MFRNYVKIALRNFWRFKGYSFINILGLSIGIAGFLVIALFLHYQLSFDNFFNLRDQIHLVIRDCSYEDQKETRANIGAPLAPLLMENYPQVHDAVRFTFGNALFNLNNQILSEDVIFSDQSLFSMLNFELSMGDPKTALEKPFSVVLSPKMARKYFGDQNPLNQVIQFKSRFDTVKNDLMVTGILEEIPVNSHIDLEIVISYQTLSSLYGNWFMTNHWDSGTLTYILLDKEFDPAEFEKLLVEFTDKYVDKGPYNELELKLIPLKKVYFNSTQFSGFLFARKGNLTVTMGFFIIAISVLIIACFNYMNLSTALATARANEVVTRKVAGAKKKQITRQFIGESILYSFIAFLFAVAIAEIILPHLTALTGVKLSVYQSGSVLFLILMLGTAILVGIFSGSYPAFFLSKFNPVTIMKGNTPAGGLKGFRTILVIFQFIISIVLITGAIFFTRQMSYIHNKDLGFKKDNIVVLPVKNVNTAKKYPLIKAELLRDKNINSITASSQVPGLTSQNGIMTRTETVMDLWLGIIYIDFDYFETLGIKIHTGRFPSRDISTDGKHAILMNQACSKFLSWEYPVGKHMDLYFKEKDKIFNIYEGDVIGTVSDFNFRSLMEPIQPVLFKIDPGRFRYILIRINGKDIPSALKAIEHTITKLSPDQPLDYFFLDQEIEIIYKFFHTVGQITWSASFLAMFIACLGLFGLASFMVVNRTKEIGIRKAFGASVMRVILALFSTFTGWIIIANAIAFPIAYFLVKYFLQNFAYRTNISFRVFLLTAFISIIIAALTVSFQAIKSANTNPAQSLRYE